MFEKKQNVPDKKLVESFTNREESAIAELDRRYGRYIYGIASNFFSDADDINDCVNDTFLSVWAHIPPDKPENLKGYVSKIVKNISINKYREKQRQKRIVSNYSICFEDCENDLGSGNLVEEEFENKRLKKLINDFANGLAERQKFIFVSRYYYCDSETFIAKNLGISVTSVSNELSNIKNALKKELMKEGFDYE